MTFPRLSDRRTDFPALAASAPTVPGVRVTRNAGGGWDAANGVWIVRNLPTAQAAAARLEAMIEDCDYGCA